MPRKSWPDFMSSCATSHLVVLTLGYEPDDGPTTRAVLQVFGRLIRRRMPEMDFGSTIVRHAKKDEVHFAFARESDACWLSAEIHARRSESDDGWASRAEAVVTGNEFLALAATLPAKSHSRRSAGGIDQGLGDWGEVAWFRRAGRRMRAE
jgi:hypothetical protein